MPTRNTGTKVLGGSASNHSGTQATTKPSSAMSQNPSKPSATPIGKAATATAKTRFSRFWATVKKWLLRLLLLLLLVAITYMAYYFEVWRLLPQAEKGLIENSSQPVENNQAWQQHAEDIQLLRQQLQGLQQQLQRNQQASLNQQNQLVQQLSLQQQQQQRQMLQINQQLVQINGQFNRWKKQLAEPERLLDGIINHLQLVEAQSLMNYSPALLAQQLVSIDAMLADINIAELSLARVEMQQLINQLDNIELAPIQFWLQEMNLAERSVDLWVQQQFRFMHQHNEVVPTQPASSEANNDVDSLNGDSIHLPWQQRLWQHISNKLAGSFSVEHHNQRQSAQGKRDLIQLNAVPVDAPQLRQQLLARIHAIQLSLLSAQWQQLRLQSADLNAWLQENLSNVDTGLADTLAKMNLYQPQSVTLSLAKSIKLIEDYQYQSQAAQFIDNAVIGTGNVGVSSSSASSAVSSTTTSSTP